jgi:hypothetical protein
MKRKRKVFLSLLLLYVLPVLVVYGGADLGNKKELEKFWMPAEVKAEVDRTFSVYGVERAESAYQLGKMGRGALKSVPFLIRLLKDELPVWCKYNGYGMWTTVRKEAKKGLNNITGEQFGNDVEKWNDWWEKNKQH